MNQLQECLGTAAPDGAIRNYDPDGVLTVALDICEGMLESGAETHRVEDTAERICSAYGADRVEIFAMTSLIVATISMPDGRDCTQARRVNGTSNNLFRIERLNALSRTICRDLPDPHCVKDEIKCIRNTEKYPLWCKCVGAVIGAFGFAMFFGGTAFDGVIAALVGMIVSFIDFHRPKYLNQVAHTVIVSAIGSLLIAVICNIWGDQLPLSAATINIGVIMLLIPGLALGNAVRDLLCGEIVSGSVKTLQCILVAGAIAAGFTGVLLLFGGNAASSAVGTVSPLLTIVMAGIGAVGFSLLFSVPPQRFFYAVICGVLGWACYLATEQLIPASWSISPVLAASFAGGVSCTCYAEVMARINKTPTTVFLIPGLIPLVPGGSLYYTMAYLVQRDYDMALNTGLKTLYTCMGIAGGIVLVSVLFQIGCNWQENVSKRRRAHLSKRREKKNSEK